jgi:ParB family chromosome partitioning protein
MKTIGTSDSMVGPVIEQAIAMNQHRPEPEHEHQPEPTPQEPTPPRLYQAPEETVETVEVVEVLSEENMTESEPNSELDVVLVDVRLIEPNPFQPRRDFGEESLNSLSESIAEHGLLQPLVVRRVDESYQLIAGERRFRAAQKSGLNEVPVRVVEADDRRMTELAIVENLQRKDLNALEKAASFNQYMESHNATQMELAGRLKIDRSTIANLVRLLELPDSIKDALTADRITQGHARALLPLGEEGLQMEFCRRIETESLTVREVERLVKETIQSADAEPLSIIDSEGNKKKPTPTDDQLAALEQEFRMALGMKVKLTQTARGRGKLAINFKSHEEFERLRDLLLATDRPQEKAG